MQKQEGMLDIVNIALNFNGTKIVQHSGAGQQPKLTEWDGKLIPLNLTSGIILDFHMEAVEKGFQYLNITNSGFD